MLSCSGQADLNVMGNPATPLPLQPWPACDLAGNETCQLRAHCRLLGHQAHGLLVLPCLSCSQVGNGNCDAGQQPVNRRQCNATPCEVTAGGLNTSFTEWGLCSASCGSGFAARTAFCRNPEGDLADLEMCSDYSGGSRASLLDRLLSVRQVPSLKGPWGFLACETCPSNQLGGPSLDFCICRNNS